MVPVMEALNALHMPCHAALPVNVPPGGGGVIPEATQLVSVPVNVALPAPSTFLIAVLVTVTVAVHVSAAGAA